MRATPPSRAETDPIAVGADWIERARSLAPMLADAAETIETRREMPETLREILIGRGFFRLLLPHSLGGAELPPALYVQVIEEVAKADASTAWCLNQTCGCSMTAAWLDAEAAREIFGHPRGILAWGPGPGEARVTAGGYRVTADFSFASGSHEASWLGAHLPIVEADGRPRRTPDGSPVIRTLLFPKSAARMTDIWHVIGLRGTGSDRWRVADLFVPEAYCLARDHEARPREPGLLYRFSNLQLYSSGFAGVALGIARSTLDALIALARGKTPRGIGRTLREDNLVQSQVAQGEARISAARIHLLGTLAEITPMLARSAGLSLDQRMTIRLASSFAIQEAREVVKTAFHAAGADAIFRLNPFERRLRDINAVAQQLQGRQEHFETVGQYLLGLKPDSLMWL